MERIANGWQWLAVTVILFHFVVPFLLLLSSERKRDYLAMLRVACLILAIHYIDLFWNITPAFHKESFHVSWLDVTAPLAVGGVWMCFFLNQARKRLPEQHAPSTATS